MEVGLPTTFKIFKNFIYSREREREGGRETSMQDRNINQLPPAGTLTRDQTLTPGMCSDRESNPRPPGLWDDTQPTEPHGPGPYSLLKF